MSTPQQLKERWETPEGNRLKCRLPMFIKKPGWEKYLIGFPFVDEIENGKDFRAIDLSNNSRLGRAKLNETDISDANFSNSNLVEAELNNTVAVKSNFFKATMSYAKLNGAILKEAILIGAVMFGIEMIGADLEGADLTNTLLQDANICNSKFNNEVSLDGADLYGVKAKQTSFNNSNLNGANFSKANLTSSEFNNSILTNCIFTGADITDSEITDCEIYGISAWDIKTNDNTITKNLIINENHSITVDDIETAQFIYLILNNKKISQLITTMRTKTVLILGSFDDKSKPMINLLKMELPKYNLIPIVFDFNPTPEQRFMETVKTLALLSKFVIVDLSQRSGQYYEIAKLVDNVRVPFVTIAKEDTDVSGMLEDLNDYYWWKQDYFSYPKEGWEIQLPILIEKEIIPWAEKVNNKLLEKRKR